MKKPAIYLTFLIVMSYFKSEVAIQAASFAAQI
jgi:hypothetical protein